MLSNSLHFTLLTFTFIKVSWWLFFFIPQQFLHSAYCEFVTARVSRTGRVSAYCDTTILHTAKVWLPRRSLISHTERILRTVKVPLLRWKFHISYTARESPVPWNSCVRRQFSISHAAKRFSHTTTTHICVYFVLQDCFHLRCGGILRHDNLAYG